MRLTFFGILVAILSIAGCAGAGTGAIYDVRPDGSRFQSEVIRVQGEPTAHARTTRPSMTLQAEAHCTGPECVPRMVILRFGRGRGLPPWEAFRAVSLEVEGSERRWEGRDFPTAHGQMLPPGHFLRIEVTPEYFVRLAEAENVRLRLGDLSLRIPRSAREPLREIAQRMNLDR